MGRGNVPALVADRGGWTWAAEVQHGLYQWTRLDFGERTEVVVHGERVDTSRGADVTWRRTETAAAAGLFLVGDAAGLLDPACSHGVLRALLSGLEAARAIAGSAHGQIAEAAAGARYTGWIATWLQRDAEELAKLYAAMPTPPTQHASARRCRRFTSPSIHASYSTDPVRRAASSFRKDGRRVMDGGEGLR